MKRKKSNVPLKAKICTVISGAIVIGVCVFSIYAQMPSCAIKSIDNPLWGGLSVLVLFLALGILYWGYMTDETK